MKIKKPKVKRITLLLLLFITGLMDNAKAGAIENGKTIFSTRCAACHNINKQMTGPALAGVEQRRSMDWIVSFVHGSQKMVQSGDKDAVMLFEKFNKTPMPDHPDLSADDIKGVIEYIKSEAKPAEETKAPFAKPGGRRVDHTPPSAKDNYIFIIYVGAILILIRGLVYAVQISSYKRKLQQETALVSETGSASQPEKKG